MPSGSFFGLAFPNRPAHFVLVTGGSRSGKSRFAVDLAKGLGQRIAYLATCRVADREMQRRVTHHQHARPASWRTIEPPADPVRAIAKLDKTVDGIIIDCLTMYVSGLLTKRHSDTAIQQRIRRLCQAIQRVSYPVIMVTNEVGAGVVPTHRLGRRFRDLAGLANQMAAHDADQVVVLIAGIPMQLKGAPLWPTRHNGTVPTRRR